MTRKEIILDKNIKVISALQEKSAKANGTVIPDSGYAGLSKVNVNLPFQAKEVKAKVKTTVVEEILGRKEAEEIIEKSIRNYKIKFNN